MQTTRVVLLAVILGAAAAAAARADGPDRPATGGGGNALPFGDVASQPYRPGKWTPTDYGFESPEAPTQQVWNQRTSQTRQVTTIQDMGPATPGGGQVTSDNGASRAAFGSLSAVGSLGALLGPRGGVDPAGRLAAGASGGPAVQPSRPFAGVNAEPGAIKQLGLAAHNLNDSAAPQAGYANPSSYQIISAGPDGAGKRAAAIAPANTRAASNVQSYDQGGVVAVTRKVVGVTK